LVGTGDVVLVILALDGQTNSATTLSDLFLSTSGDRPFYGAMVSDTTARAGYAMTTMMRRTGERR